MHARTGGVRAAALALALIGAGAAGLSAGLSSEGPASLVGMQKLTGYEVGDYVDGTGKKWLTMKASCETAVTFPVEAVIARLWDFRGAPKVFSRIEAVRVRSDDGTRAVTEQRTAVRALGLAYVSNLVFLDTVARGADGTAEVSFEMIESDGSCLYSRGGWRLSESAGAKGEETQIRYWIESCVAPSFPGQAFIMRSFGPADIKRAVRELCAALARS